MPLDDHIISHDKDGSMNEDYCKWCYADGTYTYSDMDDLINVCVPHMTGDGFTEEQARAYMKEMLPKLDYWKRYDELSDNGEFEAFKRKLIGEINALNIEGMPKLESLNALVGEYVNLPYRLPSGSNVKFLNDETTYLGNQLKEKGISNNETTRELLESGDDANLTKYANAEKIAKEYGRKKITETQWNAYKNRGESTFRNELMFEQKAKEYGVSDTKAFREAYANGDARGYAEAYKAITSLEYGTDEYGNSKKLDYTNTTREIYDSEGVQGLKNYIEVSKKLDEVGMDKKDIQILVQHNNLEYAKTHTESQLRVLKRVEDSGNAQKNWIPALKKEKLSTEDAYDVIEVMTGGKFPKETNGMNHKQIVSYYYNKKLKD